MHHRQRQLLRVLISERWAFFKFYLDTPHHLGVLKKLFSLL